MGFDAAFVHPRPARPIQTQVSEVDGVRWGRPAPLQSVGEGEAARHKSDLTDEGTGPQASASHPNSERLDDWGPECAIDGLRGEGHVVEVDLGRGGRV